MNTRYKITRLDAVGNPLLTLEECKLVFSQLPDFIYMDSFSASEDGVTMKIKGHFFMWRVDGIHIPFRFFDGEIYVAVSHPAVFEKLVEVSQLLNAEHIEG